MCKQFSREPSDVLGIEDEVVALAFNLAAGHRLFLEEMELENARLEALAASTATAAFGGIGAGNNTESNVYVDGQHRGSYDSNEWV
jgi:hypothetical protein